MEKKLVVRFAATLTLFCAGLFAQAPTARRAPPAQESLGQTTDGKFILFELAVPPGASVPLRTHDSAAFAFVIGGELEGHPIGSFLHENAGAPKAALRNTSSTAAAKALVFQNSAALPEDVKPLLEYTLTDLLDLEVTFGKIVTNPGDPSPRPHKHPGPAFAYLWKGEVVSQLEPDEPEKFKAGEFFFESPGRVHQSYLNTSKTEPAELVLFVVAKKGARSTQVPAKQ